MTNIIIDTLLPQVAEYNRLRTAVGWPCADQARTDAALAATLMCTNARQDSVLIAHARAVGDGHLYVYIQDVMVAPDHQRRGVGRLVIEDVIRRVCETRAETTFVGLLAVPGTESFYSSLGFRALGGENTAMTLTTENLREDLRS